MICVSWQRNLPVPSFPWSFPIILLRVEQNYTWWHHPFSWCKRKSTTQWLENFPAPPWIALPSWLDLEYHSHMAVVWVVAFSWLVQYPCPKGQHLADIHDLDYSFFASCWLLFCFVDCIWRSNVLVHCTSCTHNPRVDSTYCSSSSPPPLDCLQPPSCCLLAQARAGLRSPWSPMASSRSGRIFPQISNLAGEKFIVLRVTGGLRMTTYTYYLLLLQHNSTGQQCKPSLYIASILFFNCTTIAPKLSS